MSKTSPLPRYLPTALTFTFGLQFIRLLLPSFVQYLRDVVGMPSTTLGLYAIGLFALSFLARQVYLRAGAKGAFALTVGGVALLRVVEQISTAPALDLALAALGTLLFSWFIPIGLGVARTRPTGTRDFGVGILLGIAVDTALHAAGGTLDLTWQAGGAPLAVIVLLAGLSLVGLWLALPGVNGIADAARGSALPLVALGPWLLLQMLIFQNVARLASIENWGLLGSSTLLVLGNAVVLWLATKYAGQKQHPLTALAAGLLYLLALWLREDVNGVLLGQIIGAYLLFSLLRGLGKPDPDSNLKRLNIGNGLGQMLFVIPTFLYYVSYDLDLGFRSGVVPLALGVVIVGLALLANRLQADSPPAKQPMFPVAVAFGLLILPLGFLRGWHNPTSGPVPGETIRVMSYNLHQGFNTEGRLDMEAIAQVIEASGADVVALQEVSRGWLTAGSLDMLNWLSHRLDMPYVFGPTADPVWGNAILSRVPFSATTHPLPTDDLLLRRGYIRAEILTDFGEITIFATHFHHRGDGSEIRQAQAETLLATWNGIPRAIILGDLNSLPATPEMTLFREAGFVDTSQLITGPLLRSTYPSTNPARQIDYIWVTPDFTPLEFEIISSTASDHLPVVVELEIE